VTRSAGISEMIPKPLVALPGKEDGAAGVSDDELRFIMDINLTEALLCTRAVGPHMLARRSGKVINTTAKTALAGFTRAQALEWAPWGVNVNAIAPGIFPDVVTSGRRARQADHPARRTDRAAQAARAAARSRLPGALPRLARLRLHDRPDHPARWRSIAVASGSASSTNVS
jgi:NAD(P)-dependent dehydrogenase (short-subunit alcohol dehydrogenase family)